ncbi:MAG: DUF1501 domain-containing protein [Paracoccaceae bacterium]
MADPKLVVIFLRGGADGLALVSPTSDPDFLAARPDDLRVLRQGDSAGHAIAQSFADIDFRFHPQAGDLAELYRAGDLSLIHASGLTEATRSHFDAEARIERAAVSGEAGGWLGRWLKAYPPGGDLPALAVGSALPGVLEGHEAAVAAELGNLILAPGHWLAPALRNRISQGFGNHGPLDTSMRQLLDLSNIIASRIWSDADQTVTAYAPSHPYPDGNPLSQPLMTVAQTFKLGLGTRVATVDVPGWDTHVRQAGEFGQNVGALSSALMAFWRDLGPIQQDTSVVVMSEFGRRLRSNASGGTDHGRGNVMMVLGPQARGGRMLGRWPGLSNEALEEGADLAVTTDYRAVLAELLTGHMASADLSAVFPGYTPTPLGLWG